MLVQLHTMLNDVCDPAREWDPVQDHSGTRVMWAQRSGVVVQQLNYGHLLIRLGEISMMLV